MDPGKVPGMNAVGGRKIRMAVHNISKIPVCLSGRRLQIVSTSWTALTTGVITTCATKALSQIIWGK